MKSDTPIKKRAIPRLLERFGDGIVRAARIWRILGTPRSRSALASVEKKRLRRAVRPVLRRLRPILRPLEARLRRLWEWLVHFNRRTPPRTLRRICLGGFAAIFAAAILQQQQPEARKFLHTAQTFYPGKTAFFDSSNDLLGFR